MTDFTIHVAPVCRSNIEWVRMVPSSRDPNEVYRVQWTKQYDRRARFQFAYECDCISFKVNGKECKHIKAVKDGRCGWNREQEPQETPPGGCCPRCGDGIEFIKVAI